MKKSCLLAAVAFGAMSIAATESRAGYEIYDNSVSSCTALNCSSLTIPGTVLAFGPSAARWEAAVYAFPGECVRIDETAMNGASSDDEMVVVGPNGTFWRNDDFGSLRPRVAFVAPSNGWYYVTIGHFTGNPVEHNFTVRYGRYAGGAANPNCASPTAPALAAPALKPSAAPHQTDPARAPGH